MKLLDEKLLQYLIHLTDTIDLTEFRELLIHSKLYTTEDDDMFGNPVTELRVIMDPEVFKSFVLKSEQHKKTFIEQVNQISPLKINRVKVYPDLDNFQILQNRIVPIITPWQEINLGQNELLNQLRTANHEMDFQNIGNSCRTLLQKITTEIFRQEKHVADGYDLSEAKFKNRLHTYIKCELGGEKNKEMRDYASTLVTLTEKSCDLSNKLTHDLNASSMMAESCVISTISVISIIRLIQKRQSDGVPTNRN